MKTLKDTFETVKQMNEQVNIKTDKLVLTTSMNNIEIINASRHLDKNVVLEFELLI